MCTPGNIWINKLGRTSKHNETQKYAILGKHTFLPCIKMDKCHVFKSSHMPLENFQNILNFGEKKK